MRFDIGTLRPATRTKDGRLRAEGLLTRSGVFEYLDGAGKVRREYRPPDEVFHVDSLGSFEMVPVTDDHPPEMVTAANARQFVIGNVGERMRREGDHVAATVVVHDAKTIAKMKAGKVALSCGYEADVLETPGVTPSGEAYDAVQTNIRGNHVAIVDVARAGAAARVRMDRMDSAQMVAAPRTDEIPEETMDEVQRLNALLAERDSEIADLKRKVRASGDPSKAGVDVSITQAPAPVAPNTVNVSEAAPADPAKLDSAALRVRCDRLEAERDDLKAQLLASQRARQDAVDAVSVRVRERVALETGARAALGSVAIDGMSAREIRCAVVKKMDGIDLPADKSDDYVTARYDAAIERVGRSTAALGGIRAAVEGARTDASADPEDAARDRMCARSRDAYKAKEN